MKFKHNEKYQVKDIIEFIKKEQLNFEIYNGFNGCRCGCRGNITKNSLRSLNNVLKRFGDIELTYKHITKDNYQEGYKDEKNNCFKNGLGNTLYFDLQMKKENQDWEKDKKQIRVYGIYFDLKD